MAKRVKWDTHYFDDLPLRPPMTSIEPTNKIWLMKVWLEHVTMYLGDSLEVKEGQGEALTLLQILDLYDIDINM